MKRIACHWLALLLIGTLSASAQDAKKAAEPQKEPEGPVHVIPFWDSTQGSQVRASVAVIGAGSPLGTLSTRVAASENVPTIPGWPFVFERVLPIKPAFLERVVDDRPWPNMTRKETIDLRGPDLAVYLALNQAIELAHRATPEMFERSAIENVTYTDLHAHPKRHRGSVITIKGKMAVLRRVEAPRLVYDKNFITHCYTGWVIGPTKGAPPYCILFTELPNGIEVSENFNREVTFHGYFLAHVRFPADKERGVGTKDMVAPYLVGKTLTVHPGEAKVDVVEPQSHELVFWSVGGIAVTLGFLVVLNVWLRRGDSRIQSQVDLVRYRAEQFNLEPAELPPPPIVAPTSTEIKEDKDGTTDGHR